MVRIWIREGIRWDTGVNLPPRTEDLKEYAVFGISPSLIAKCNFREINSTPIGLTRPHSLTVKQISIVPSSVWSYAIGKFSRKQVCSQSLVVLEWARSNPTKISEFLRRMGSDINFQKFYCHMYDPLRHMYRRLFNCEALTVVFMEGVLIRTLRHKYAEESAVTAHLLHEYRIRQKRMTYLQEMIDVGDDNLRARWAKDIPALPEWVIS